MNAFIFVIRTPTPVTLADARQTATSVGHEIVSVDDRNITLRLDQDPEGADKDYLARLFNGKCVDCYEE